MITGATLFSGIGAPEVAMPHWNWAWHAEIEKFPSAVMAARHPGSINLGDVSADGFAEKAGGIGRPDVLVFGSPCQSYSIAGKRLGLDDPRGNLALTALRIVARLKPRWFLFENVPGLFSSWSGEADGPLQAGAEWDSEENSDFVAFLSLVDELGYSGAWCVLDAQYAGVAQRRDRVFFAGHSGDWRASAAVLLEPESLRGNHPPRREAGQDVAGCLSARPSAGGGLGTDFDLGGGLTAYGGNNTSGPIDVATALNAHGGPNGAQGGVRRLTPRECERLQGFPDDYTLIDYRGKRAADGPRYKALGNSMAVPVIRWILTRIEIFERDVRPGVEAA